MRMCKHPQNSLGAIHPSILPLHVTFLWLKRIMSLQVVSVKDVHFAMAMCRQYCLSAPACSPLTLKEELLSSVKAVYEGRTCLCGYRWGLGTSFLCFQILLFVFHYMLGLIGFGKSSAFPLISLLVSPMVDQVQKLWRRDAKTSISSSVTGIVAMAQELLATSSSFQGSRLFFCAPESLMKGIWREALENPLVSVCHYIVLIDIR